MTQTTARIKKAGKHFEIIVDIDLALKYKKGLSNSVDFLDIDHIYSGNKKGQVASDADMIEAFKTTDVNEIASKIVKEGEILITQEQRSSEQEQKIKQVIDFLTKNCIDPKTGNPHTAERIRMAMEEAKINVKNIPLEQQIKEIIEKISKVIPIRLEMKKVKIVIPAVHTGKAYGIVSTYKESEEWLNNGDLKIIVNVPSGIVINFYDKLNSVTHGSALTEEIKEK